MWYPTSSDAFLTTEAPEYSAYTQADAGFSMTREIQPVARGSKARIKCTWKNCDHQEHDPNEMKSVSPFRPQSHMGLTLHIRKHANTHRRCPKKDCGWAEARDQKEMRRHVWNRHRAWAERTGFSPMGAQCKECLATFSREDGLSRHKKEVHGSTRRVRKGGG